MIHPCYDFRRKIIEFLPSKNKLCFIILGRKECMEKRIYDISPVISEKTAVFPGDTPYQRERLMAFDQGNHLELSTIKTTVHLGAHTDAPIHYHKDGVGMEKRSLDHYLGRCQVIECTLSPRERIKPEHIVDIVIFEKRVLFKTSSFTNPNQWHDNFNSLSSELIFELHKKGVITVGIDTPSVDLSDDKILESHHAIYECDMAILEGIILEDVRPGTYELIALPLPLKGADASPVRAILREI